MAATHMAVVRAWFDAWVEWWTSGGTLDDPTPPVPEGFNAYDEKRVKEAASMLVGVASHRGS
jgi:hypothetical protein